MSIKTRSLNCRNKNVHRFYDTLVSVSWVLSMFPEVYKQFEPEPNVQFQK